MRKTGSSAERERILSQAGTGGEQGRLPIEVTTGMKNPRLE
jgi:hypothetical protein